MMLLAALLGLPRWAKWALAGTAALMLLVLAMHLHDRSVIATHEVKIARKAQVIATAAAESAAHAAAGTANEVEKGNEQARDAAARSDDPLKSGLDRLRR